MMTFWLHFYAPRLPELILVDAIVVCLICLECVVFVLQNRNFLMSDYDLYESICEKVSARERQNMTETHSVEDISEIHNALIDRHIRKRDG